MVITCGATHLRLPAVVEVSQLKKCKGDYASCEIFQKKQAENNQSRPVK
jgi:hypothetical protein